MPKQLPQFSPVDVKEMRRFWKQYRGNPDVERLLLEIQYNRNVIHEIEVYFTSILKAWKEENLGNLVAIEKTRVLLIEQHSRFGALQGLAVPTNKRDDDQEPALVD